jgi:Trk K+ transport system NAD-binding subunit
LLLRLLESGYEIVVIEQDWESEFVQDALALKVPVIHGDGRRGRVLRQAGVFRARGLVTAISNDLINIEVALAAKRMRSDMLIVLRIFNEQLDYSLEHSQFGRNTAFSSSALAAPTLAAASVCMGIKYALPLPEAQLAISDITVTAGSTLDSLVYKIERQFNVQVICYTGENSAGEMQWRHRVSPTTRLYGGDRIKLLGTLPALGAVWKHGHVSNKIMDTLGISIPQQPTPQYNRVIVCGLGKVGYRVVKALYYTEPRPEIVVICSGETRERFVKEIRELGIEVRLGDARTAEELEAAGIDHAYAVAAVTSDNLTNLRISLTARQLRDDIHVVVRVFSDVLADHLEALFGIHTTFSTSALAAPTLAAAVVVRDTGYAVDIGEQLLSVARLTVSAGDEFDGQQISALREHRAIVVVTVRRGSRMFVMPHDPDYPDRLFERPLQPGDEIVVMAEIHTIAHLRSLGAETAISDIGSSRMMPERLSRATRLADTNCITAPHLAAVGGNGSAHQPPTDTEEILQRLLSTDLPPDELSGTAQRVAAGKTKE